MSNVDDIIAELNSKMNKKYKTKAPELFRASELPPVEWLATGMLGYDWVNGGGAPRGHAEQIYGRKSCGKTTVCLRRIAEAQRQGIVCAFIDLEHTFDETWAKKHGVDLDKLILHNPFQESGETTLTVVETMLATGEIGMIVVDSVPALCPEAMLDKGLEDKHYGGNSALLEQFFKRIIGPGLLYDSNCVLIFINQPRDVIGSRIPMERLPGGRALSHYTSIHTEVKRGDFITEVRNGEEIKIGQEVKLINRKNKVRWPFREQTLRLHFANGFNPLFEVVQFAVKYDLVEKSGAWLYYDGESMGQGINNHMSWLYEHREVYGALRKQILEKIRAGV